MTRIKTSAVHEWADPMRVRRSKHSYFTRVDPHSAQAKANTLRG